MFRFLKKRRVNLTRRLERLHKTQTVGHEGGAGATDTTLHDFLDKLERNQLELLAAAVENRGEGPSNCILLPREDAPHVISCRLWRWPNLHHAAELHRMPSCRSAYDPIYTCCNPYHWSRLWIPDTPPPPYYRFNVQDRAPSEMVHVFEGSVATNGEDSAMQGQWWCKLAYWEMNKRVGRQYMVENPFIHIFGRVPYGDGFCLEDLALSQHSFSPPSESVSNVRNKIGLGIVVSCEEEGVWVYNCSAHPVFVHSPTLEEPSSQSPTRVPPDCCLCAYDLRSDLLGPECTWSPEMGPVDLRSIKVSFVKGWGRSYSRQHVMQCPCWLEILLAPCR